MSFTPLTFQQFLELLVTVYEANADVPADTGEGSTMGAIFNAQATLAGALQNQVLYAVDVARLATSEGPDVDTFVNAFGITRDPAVNAEGTLQFSTPSPATAPVYVPFGVTLTRADGIQFVVISDSTLPGWTTQGYVIATGATSVLGTVQCVVGGTIGNMLPGTVLTPIGSSGVPLPAGVNSASNPAAFTSGTEAETDDALKARFTLTVSSGRYGVHDAYVAAIESISETYTFTVADHTALSGADSPGDVTIFVSAPGANAALPGPIIAQITAACEAIRAGGDEFTVNAPTYQGVDCVGVITVDPAYDPTATTNAAIAAYRAYIGSIGLDPKGAPTKAIFYKAAAAIVNTPGVTDLTGFTFGGAEADITAAFGVQLYAGTVAITHT
jgi:phage-related baseplate assembly protein